MNVKTTTTFIEALESDGPSPELGKAAGMYDWLIGCWNMRIVDYDADGSPRETLGEWHFGWVLEGRAVQDVFIVPPRNIRSASTPKEGNRYGTTLRYYDPKTNAWHITWTNPVRQVQNHLIARKVGNEIIQEGQDPNGEWTRWSFRDITPDSFRWTGEESTDNGKTWHLGAEFFGVRQKRLHSSTSVEP